MSLSPLPLHMGTLHTYEAVLLAILAFGPFVILTVIVVVIRRRDAAAEVDHDISEASGRAATQQTPPESTEKE